MAVFSADGCLSVEVDTDHAGVILRAHYGDNPQRILRTNWVTNPNMETDDTYWAYTGNGTGFLFYSTDFLGNHINSAKVLFTGTSPDVSGGLIYNDDPGLACGPGDVKSVSMQVACSKAQCLETRLDYLDAADAILLSTYGAQVLVAPDETTTMTVTNSDPAPAGTTKCQVWVYAAPGTGGVAWNNGDTLEVFTLMVTDGPIPGDHFYGGSEALPGQPELYRYTGVAGESPSQEFLLPYQVRFERDGLRVRSGDPAWAPGGFAVAYDHEATLGASASWRAIPLYRDDVTGEESQPASVIVPELTDTLVWIKSLEDPGLSLKVQGIKPLPTFTRSARMSLYQVSGSKYPNASLDVRSARTGDLTILTFTTAEAEALDALTEGVHFLVQFPDGIRQFYCLIGDVSEGMFRLAENAREWTLPLVEIDRPSTVGSPLVIPGGSYDDHRSGTYDNRTDAWPTYDDHLGSPGLPDLIDESGGADDEGTP